MTFPIVGGDGGPIVDFFHTGIVVADMEAAMAELTDLMGVHWREVRESSATIEDPGGRRTVDMRYVHSLEGPPYLELVQSIAGTVWEDTGPGRVHHIGVAVNDPVAFSAAARTAGMTWMVSDSGGDQLGERFSYFLARCGALIEWVTPKARHNSYLDRSRAAWPDIGHTH